MSSNEPKKSDENSDPSPTCLHTASKCSDSSSQNSGGSQTAPLTHVQLVHTELSVSDVTSLVSNSRCGAISLFVGTTRDLFDSKEVVSLEYEAYGGMAEKEMLKLCNETREQWPVTNIAIIHRLGRVAVCEASIIVAVSSVHRAEAMAATTFIMDRIKARVPVWKKEVYTDGSKSWKENKECSWRSNQ